ELTLITRDGVVLVDYDPTVNAGDTTPKHNPNVLGKLNLAERNVAAAKELVAGRSGVGIAMHARKKVDQVSGYTKITGPKFVDSIGWGVLVRVEKAEIFAAMDKAEKQFFAVILSICIICIGVIFWFTSSLSKVLVGISEKLAASGSSVLSGSTQLSGASQTVSSGATQSASALEETVSSIEELSNIVKLNAENAKQAASLSQVSTQSAEVGESEIRKLTEAMKDISQSSKKIEEIINVIDDIAFQTNLLALNAAVEAARAGEQGKGFAVVAEAVRNLAQRSSAAAKDITDLIKESVSKTEHGSKIADSSGNVLKEIVTSVKKVGHLNGEVASASTEQANGILQISKAMNELDSSTQQNAAASEEMAASADQMSEQARFLSTLVLDLSSLVNGQKSPAKGAPKDAPHALKTSKPYKKSA
ncbi:MAG: methyl-accepting chemotaxis protein, partial [Bdellovibrionota bacterium]